MTFKTVIDIFCCRKIFLLPNFVNPLSSKPAKIQILSLILSLYLAVSPSFLVFIHLHVSLRFFPLYPFSLFSLFAPPRLSSLCVFFSFLCWFFSLVPPFSSSFSLFSISATLYMFLILSISIYLFYLYSFLSLFFSLFHTHYSVLILT